MSTPEAIKNWWCDMNPLYVRNWLNKFYSFYIAIVVNIISRRGLSIDALSEKNLISVS